jgi:hypothetical protein
MLYSMSMTQRVEAHLHLPRAKSGAKNCISFRDLPRGHARYASALHLTNAAFVVQPAGLRRFLETGQKNVHAFVRGTLESITYDRWPGRIDLDWKQVSYNPLYNDRFVIKNTGQGILWAPEVILIGTSVWYR